MTADETARGLSPSTYTADGREELYASWKVAVRGEAGSVPGCCRATIFVHDDIPRPGNL